MTVRSLAIILALTLAAPALAQDRTVPGGTAPQVGQSVDTLPADSLYSDPTIRRLGLDLDLIYPDPYWFEREGIDSPIDEDPRPQFHLPRPEPQLILDLD